MGSTSQPNILLLMADQMAAPFLAPWGGPAITPAIDRLAAEGVVFESTYSNSPLCAPARCAMMAGQYNSRIGAYDNASEFAASVPTFAHFLRSAGYQTSLAGKMHFVGPDQLHGFEERLTTDIYPADFGWTPNWEDPEGRFDWWYHNLDSVTFAGVAQASNQLDYDDEVGFRTLRKLRDLARSNDERPWLVTASFTHPHDPYVARQALWDRYRHDEIPLPAVGSIPAAADDPHSLRLRQLMKADTTEVTPAQIRNARHAYFANCSYVDDRISEIRQTLDDSGMAENTIILFTADHGDMLGERGLWYKMSFFENASRVPLIIHSPERYSHKRVTTQTSLLDIAPTLIDLGEGSREHKLDGSSLVPFLEGAEEPDRTVAGEYLGEGAVAPVFMLRRGTLKFIWSEPDGAQLVDLASDPDELKNLVGDAAYKTTVADFEAEVTTRWNPAELSERVLASQHSRRTVDKALRQGEFSPWDFQPHTDAAQQYMRNHLDLNEVESGRRLS